MVKIIIATTVFTLVFIDFLECRNTIPKTVSSPIIRPVPEPIPGVARIPQFVSDCGDTPISAFLPVS